MTLTAGRGIGPRQPELPMAVSLSSSSVPPPAPRTGGAAPRRRPCWQRAAQLTPEPGQRARRFLDAAAADLTAGNSVRAHTNLAQALPELHDPVLVARAQQLRATIEFADSRTGHPAPQRVDKVASLMLDAARAYEPLDVHRARDAVFDALQIAILCGDSSTVSAVL